MTNLLKGMRIVEGSAFVAVPLAGMTLAQMGAEVIRFDRIGGGLDAGRLPLAPSGQSLFWAGLNKGKKSIAVDMKSPEGRELVTRIITAPGPDAGMFKLYWSEYHKIVTELSLDIIGADAMVPTGQLPQTAFGADFEGAPNSTNSWVGTFLNARAGT
ncbi:MAG: CoA transferase, partial [Lutimaribacter sp.]